MKVDIFNLPKTKVVAGIEGKCILIHSDERKLGKTYQSCQMPKPLYIRFEQGVNAINGLDHAPISNWREFKDFNKQLTNPKTLEQVKEMYSTIIFDTVDVAIKWCDAYICQTNGVTKIGDANKGYGAWKEYENEWFNEINKLTNAGYTVIFIAHSEPKTKIDPTTNEEYVQMCPKGSKRDIDLILDLVDFIGYVKSNGYDENGEEIPSSIYFANTKDFQAGSRFKYMPKIIKHFTAQNVIDAIKFAVKKEEEETGQKAISYEEKKQLECQEKIPFDEMMEKVGKYGNLLKDKGYGDKVTEIIEEVLGVGKKVGECTERQYDAVGVVLDELKDAAKELSLEIKE